MGVSLSIILDASVCATKVTKISVGYEKILTGEASSFFVDFFVV